MSQYYLSFKFETGNDEELINQFNFVCSETELERLKGIANLTPRYSHLCISGLDNSDGDYDGYYITDVDIFVDYDHAVDVISNAAEITPEELSTLKKFGVKIVEDEYREHVFNSLLGETSSASSDSDDEDDDEDDDE